MGCNCKRKSAEPTPEGLLSQAERAAICQTCPFSAKNKEGSAVKCTVNNTMVAAIATDRNMECPKGRFSNVNNETKAYGLTWLGVSIIDRFRLLWLLKRKPEGFVNCGCSKWLKNSRFGVLYNELIEETSEGLYDRFESFVQSVKEIEYIR